MDGSRKNTSISRNTQHINIRLALLYCWGPVHPNDSCIVALASLAYSQKKCTIHCPIIDTVIPLYIQLHYSVLEAAMITKSWSAAGGSWSLTMLQKSYRLLLYRTDRGRSLEIHTIDQSLTTFGCHFWKAIAPASNRKHQNWNSKKAYGTNASNYTCHPNIHCVHYFHSPRWWSTDFGLTFV